MVEKSRIARSRAQRRKAACRELLVGGDRAAIAEWATGERNPMHLLSRLLFDDDLLIRWRAIAALGQVGKTEFSNDPDRVRRQIQRLLWLTNDESGGICWMALEAIGELVYCCPALIDEYGPRLPSFFAEEPFEWGARWAVYRLAETHSPFFAGTEPALRESLTSDEAAIRGISLLALGRVATACQDVAGGLVEDQSPFTLYDMEQGELAERTVGQVARELLQ